MALKNEEEASNKAEIARKSCSSKPKRDHVDNKFVKMCPFQEFKICDGLCKYYICHGRPRVIEERMSKGYASEYLKSVLF
jgi:hypothetical protein